MARDFRPLVILAVFWLAGCGDPYGGRVEVNGQVKLDGEPLKEGQILFAQLESQGTEGGAPIMNGAYKIPREQGLKPGRYLIRITSGDGQTPANSEAAPGPGGHANIISKDRIPPEWNSNSKQEVTVKPNEINRFEFDIPAKKH